MSSSHDQQHGASAGVGETEIIRGAVGVIGQSRVGVVGIAATPPPVQGAMPGAKATLVVVQEVSGVPVESTLVVRDRMLLPLADGLHRVVKLAVAGSGSDARGKVAIATEVTQAAAPGMVVVGDEGKLRIGGPDVDSANDLHILEWVPDKHAPESATVEWLPAAYARADTPPSSIKQQSLKVGDRLQVGQRMLKVKSLDGETQDHPAWIEFELVPGG